MSELPKIDNEESLKAWLETRLREDVVLVAHRVAMRVAPFWFSAMDQSQAQPGDLTAVPILRLNLISEVARTYSPFEIAATVFSAAIAAADEEAGPFAATTAAAAATAATASAAAATASAAAVTENTAAFAARAAAFAADAVTVIWSSIQADVHALIKGEDPSEQPLWPDKNLLAGEWERSKPILRVTPGGDFWIDWYQRALNGRPQNWPLLRDVALIDDALWKEGGEALDVRIRELREHHALAATANAERIEWNPDTGKLRLVSDTDWPEGDANYARRKITRAIEVFNDQPGQGYGALDADRAMLRRAVDDAGNLPVELYDACSSATRRLEVRIQNGECPSAEQDALIADYRNRLREAAVDILASDAEAAKVLERRAAITGNDALIEGRETILEVVEAAGPLLEGRLANTLPQDAEIATRRDAPPEDRAAASFLISGRLLRIKQVCKGFSIGTRGVVRSADFLRAIEYLATSEVSGILFRFLGL